MTAYEEQFNMTVDTADERVNAIQEHFHRDEFTYEDIAKDLILYAELLKSILVLDNKFDYEDEETQTNLECAISELELASKEVFYADSYFRQYKFDAFQKHVQDSITQQ